uniref:GIR1-like zinc ribbon domain-containing protein n=1 Tax=Glycine max TaxID=3847 RepID=C6TJR1_SOYBN|nr:unknown [Glycine max]
MAAEVSSLIRVMGGGYKEEQHRTVGNESHGEKSTALITRDLLGGSSSIESQELDLDLQVPSGWEKRLDLQSGKVHLQKCNTTIGSPPIYDHNKLNAKPAGPKLQDLNFPSSSTSNVLLNLFDETSLDLKLVSSTLPSSNNYQSVCTLDKVKSALERAEKEPIVRKRTSFLKSPLSASSPSYSSSSSSIRETIQEEECEERLNVSSSPLAAGCPGCLSYVMIMKNNPKCPRRNSLVPIPSMKKPRIDLNISI